MILTKSLTNLGCIIEIKDLSKKSELSILNGSPYFEAIVIHPIAQFRVTQRLGVCSQYFLDNKGFDYLFQVFDQIEKTIKELQTTGQQQ